MKIITNADDFGLSDETVTATIECFKKGALTSATIMPNMPGTAAAMAYARRHPELSFGVHLTFVAESNESKESCVADPRYLPTLAMPDGRLRPSHGIRLLALQGRIPKCEIEIESSAQIKRISDLGVQVSHVDSHGHLHKFSSFREALRIVLPRFGIRKVRNVQDIYLDKPFSSPTYWFGGYWRRQIMSAFDTTDHFYMPTSSQRDIDWPLRVMKKMGGTSLEVGIHPGYSEPWRDAERRAVIEFLALVKAAGHHLVTWNQV